MFGKRRRRQPENPDAPPESYWVARAGRVIGSDQSEPVTECRQRDTYRAIFEQLRPDCPEVLDLGCNVGVLGQLLQHWNYPGRYFGLDSNPFAATVARERVPRGRFLVGNIRRLPFASASRAAVVMKDVIEHMEDFRPVLGEAARIAKDYLVIAAFIPWQEAPQEIVRHPKGFYRNRYQRSEVLDFLDNLGWSPDPVVRTVEQDGRKNEVVTFRRRSP